MLLRSLVARRNKPPPHLSAFLSRHLCSSSAASSKLRDHYDFVPPSSLSPENRPSYENPTPPAKKQKERYRPPSSINQSRKPMHSDLPFDFRYSYSESSQSVRPIGLREPKYSPFGPRRLDRKWTGVCAPAVDPKVKSVDEADLGRDGFTHNMLNDVHNNWRHAEAVRIKCLGVPTVDMKNVCAQLEDKTFGKIIHRHGGQLVLYRGRNYNPKKRPAVPLMLWRPHEPVYPKLIKTTIEGLSIDETKEMRKKGLAVPVLTRLAKNGYYGSLVPMVRDAFIVSELVRVDCQGLERSDYKKIGCKLRDLVPCILVTFEKEQIVVWRGTDYKPPEDGDRYADREFFDDSEGDVAFAEDEHSCSDK
ncbi:CRS2-associated factor 1, mitochondrial [Linum grandiflorum]